MKNQFEDKQNDDKQSEQQEPELHKKNGIGMPLLALGLSVLPFLLAYTVRVSNSLMLLIIVLSPLAGLITGMSCLKRGKKRIGLLGVIISVAAITIPLAVVSLIVIFFIGVTTGIISFM